MDVNEVDNVKESYRERQESELGVLYVSNSLQNFRHKQTYFKQIVLVNVS